MFLLLADVFKNGIRITYINSNYEARAAVFVTVIESPQVDERPIWWTASRKILGKTYEKRGQAQCLIPFLNLK